MKKNILRNIHLESFTFQECDIVVLDHVVLALELNLKIVVLHLDIHYDRLNELFTSPDGPKDPHSTLEW